MRLLRQCDQCGNFVVSHQYQFDFVSCRVDMPACLAELCSDACAIAHAMKEHKAASSDLVRIR